MGYIHIVQHHSAIEKEETMPFLATGERLEMIMLSEVSETEKDKYRMISLLGGVSVRFSRSVVSDSLQPHEPQHSRPPCPSPTPRAYSNSRPSSR